MDEAAPLPTLPGPALAFDNRFLQELPTDPEVGPRLRQVRGAAHSRVWPTPVAAPRLLALNTELAARIGIDPAWHGHPHLTAVFAGNALWPGMEPHAACYGGHQFGHWAGQLGDGRVIALGEVVGSDGGRHELQLKGAGPTPYSRRADGRAVLRSSLREYVASEAMVALGIPTTRALTLIATGEEVERDLFYDGHPRLEPGAIVCRVAPSFLRIGTLELPAARGEGELLERLLDFCIARDHPDLTGSRENRRGDWLHRVCLASAELVAQWLRVGFVHGVLNTDNVSLSGLTLDYGPFGWLEEVDPEFTPNTTDAEGRRYAFARQPAVMAWNLAMLAQALSSLLPEDVRESSLAGYARRFAERHRALTLAKFGLAGQESAFEFCSEGYRLLADTALDHTLFFRRLASDDGGEPDRYADLCYRPEAFDRHAAALGVWLAAWRRRCAEDGVPAESRRVAMDTVNPLYLPRNYLLQQAIDGLEQGGDTQPLDRLLVVLADPYREQAGAGDLARPRPEWARTRPGCAMLSCSS